MRPRSVVFLAVLLLMVVMTGSASAASGPMALVLRNGTSLEVAAARVQGDQVYVTFANGRMQAYAVSDVDLEASGLVETSEATAPPKEAEPPAGSMAAAQSTKKGLGGYTITDQDVAHVRGEAPGEGEESANEEEQSKGAASSLLISDLRRKLTGSTLSVTGTVSNNGQKGVSAITLEADAVDGEGKPVGSGTTVISQELKPKQAVGFSLAFDVTGQVADVRVRAAAAVADFDFNSVAPPSAKSGRQGEGAAGETPPPPKKPSTGTSEGQQSESAPSPMQWAPQGSGNQWAPTAPVSPGGTGG